VSDTLQQGELFKLEPFEVRKEQVRFAGGALTLNNDEEARVLRSLKEGQIAEIRLFVEKKGVHLEYGEVTHVMLITDHVIDTE
jgi:hypothetical protein